MSRYAQEFEEIGPLGSGSFGDVYEAKHLVSQARYAVKEIRLQHTDRREIERSFKEVQSWVQLEHMNVVRYHNSWLQHCPRLGPEETLQEGTSQSQFLLIQMELCDQTLEKWLESSAEPKPFGLRVSLLSQLLSGLQHIHELDFVHSDLHTRNILLKGNVRERMSLCLKITDFGLVKLKDVAVERSTMRSIKSGEMPLNAYTRSRSVTKADDLMDAATIAIKLFADTQDEKRIFEVADIEPDFVRRYFLNKFRGQATEGNVQIGDVVDVVAELMHKDPKRRLSAKQACQRLKEGRDFAGAGIIPLKKCDGAVVMSREPIWSDPSIPTVIIGIVTDNFSDQAWNGSYLKLKRLFDITDRIMQIKVRPEQYNRSVMDTNDMARQVTETTDYINSLKDISIIRMIHVGPGHALGVEEAIDAIIKQWNKPLDKKDIQFVAIGDSDQRVLLEMCRWLCLSGACSKIQFYQAKDYNRYGVIDVQHQILTKASGAVSGAGGGVVNLLLSLQSAGTSNPPQRNNNRGPVIEEIVDENNDPDLRRAIQMSLEQQ